MTKPIVRIITYYEPKPNPSGQYDWEAWRGTYPDEGEPIGYGKTEQAAIDDLLEQEGDEE